MLLPMVICFDATAEAKKALDILTRTGQFRDISEVISMALTNYEILQRAIPNGGQPILATPQRPEAAEPSHVLTAPAIAQPSNSRGAIPNDKAPRAIPELFALKTTTIDEALLLPTPPHPDAEKITLAPA